MVPDRIFVRTAGIIVLLSLTLCLFMPPVTAGENVATLITPAPDLNITNYSIGTDGRSGDFIPGPTPITILRVELNQSTLPGPRDMGYGPSVIDLTVSPQILAVIFIIILIGLAVWMIWRRRTKREPDEPNVK